jgi:hypothetical protein
MALHPAPAATGPRFAALPIPRPAVLARDALYLCAGLPLGIVTFTVLVTGLSLAAGLAVTLVGVPVLLATMIAARAMADVERRRAGWVLLAPITRGDRPWTGGLWVRFRASALDPGAWRDLVWGLILLPFGILGFTVAVTTWSCAFGLLASPLWYWSIPEDGTDIHLLNSHDIGASAFRVALGLVLLPVAAWTCRGLADLTARAAHALLAH